jgi:hypothetical protein
VEDVGDGAVRDASGAGSTAGAGGDDAGASAGRPGACDNLQCQQRSDCPGSGTTISGVVYDPAGKNPTYNAAVYVPNEPVEPLSSGVSCGACDAFYSGLPIASALTDSSGRFTLANAPDGVDVPLVVQVGKWRRQFTLPVVTACQDNPQPDGMLQLPGNSLEGDIPNIAIATGAADTLECLLRRVGIDASEFVPGADGAGRVHIFAGTPLPGAGAEEIVPNTTPPAPLASAALWSSAASLMAYDVVLLSCEGAETRDMNQQALHDYASAGGRVFASHFHYAWFNTGPYASENLATWHTGSNDLGDIQGETVTTLANGMPFPKGVALSEWLQNVGALQSGTLPIVEARYNADVAPSHPRSQPWIIAGPGSAAPGATQHFSFNTPTDPGGRYCGRVVYSDLHVGAASGDDPALAVPTGCADSDLSAQEAALEFMLFDLASCVVPDDVAPTPPIVR